MNKNILSRHQQYAVVTLSVILSLGFFWAVALGATTISTNLSTDGSLTVGGATTFNTIAYTWPAADGSATNVLTTDGSGTLSWAAAGSSSLFTDGGATTRLTSTDNLGVGTTSTAFKLGIQGNALFSGNLNLANLTATGTITVTGSGTSTIAGGLDALALNIISTTASSTFANGINLSAGCFSINGTCVGSGGGTINSGTTGQFPYYASDGTTLTATSTLFVSTASRVGIGTTTPNNLIEVKNLINFDNAKNMTALGYQALNVNTTGSSNTAIGYQALFSNTSGTENTALGRTTLYSNTTGRYNTALGFQALSNSTTGDSNTALGYQALASNIGGYQNTALGYQALSNSTTGLNNTAFGYQAGKLQADGSTALIPNNSVYLGYGTRGKDNSDSNSIVIGYNAVGIGANSVVLGNDSITTTALKGNVGVGTTTPTTKFHVTSGASATTTVNFGEVGSATSKSCFNTKNTAGTDISFYFVGTTMTVESNLCR